MEAEIYKKKNNFDYIFIYYFQPEWNDAEKTRGIDKVFGLKFGNNLLSSALILLNSV